MNELVNRFLVVVIGASAGTISFAKHIYLITINFISYNDFARFIQTLIVAFICGAVSYCGKLLIDFLIKKIFPKKRRKLNRYRFFQ